MHGTHERDRRLGRLRDAWNQILLPTLATAAVFLYVAAVGAVLGTH